MPQFTGLIYNNVPVEIDVDNEGAFQEAWVECKSGAFSLDLDDEGGSKLIAENQDRYDECMYEFHKNKKEYDKWLAKEMRK